MAVSHNVKEPVNDSGQRIKAGSFTLYHWVVVLISVTITLVGWNATLKGVQDRTQAEFDRQADNTVSLFEHQLERYADLLRSNVGFIAGSESVLPDEWRAFSKRIDLEEQFPAIGGVGIVYRIAGDEVEEFVRKERQITPDFAIRPQIAADQQTPPAYVMPITLITPENLEATVLGLDVAREARRRDAIDRTIKTGAVQITAPINPSGTDEAGFVLIAPIFDTAKPETEALRRSGLIGVVVAAVITKNLAKGILDSDVRQVALRVSDDAEVVYDELGADNPDLSAQKKMVYSRTVPLFGRDWRFDVQNTQAFMVAQRDFTPALILAAGLAFNLLLSLLLLNMSRANQRLDEFGKTMSDKYDAQSLALEDRCEELEAFSYVVSHDLKAPLRAVSALTEFFMEDFGDYHPDVTLHSELTVHLQRINKQVTLAQSLVTGVLQYSGLEREVENAKQVDVLELLHSLRTTLTVDAEQLQLVGEFPVFETYQIQLTQVFLNLVSNGYKYHVGDGLAVVTVSMEPSGQEGFYRFTISDNGPGIKKEFHERIFEPFTTLQPKDHSISSGVGLAIVSKLVRQHGGGIELVSDVGQGARFSFDWPCAVAYSSRNEDYLDLPKAA